MADKKSLSMFGLIFGVVTAAVMLVAAVTVHAQIDGRLSPDGASPQIVAGSPSGLMR
jgi:hypothetical protein